MKQGHHKLENLKTADQEVQNITPESTRGVVMLLTGRGRRRFLLCETNIIM